MEVLACLDEEFYGKETDSRGTISCSRGGEKIYEGEKMRKFKTCRMDARAISDVGKVCGEKNKRERQG